MKAFFKNVLFFVNFNQNQIDPRFRHTFWTIIIGSFLGGSGNNFCVSQSFIQRILACKNQKDVSKNEIYLY